MIVSLDFARGRAAERNRIAAIVRAPVARNRLLAAVELALNSTLTVEEAQSLLAATGDRPAMKDLRFRRPGESD